jgi:hypothetical protein
MTFDDLKLRAATLASFDGWTNTVPSPDWAALVNQAWRRFSWEAEVMSGSMNTTSVISQSAYTLSPAMKRVLDVIFAGTPLLRSSQDFERFLSPGWRTVAGTPKRFVQESVNSVALVPAPSAASAMVVWGVVQGSDMVASTDQPGQVSGVGTAIPTNLHEAIALMAAVYQGKIAMQGESSARMKDYLDEYQSYVRDCLVNNGRLDEPAPAGAGA